MMRPKERPIRPSALATGLLLVLACGEGPPSAALETERIEAPERIFLFIVDTLRRDHVSVYGTKAKTPTIDALSARGQRIDSAFSAYHQTTMSMAALFSGRTPALESGEPEKALPWTSRVWCGMARYSSNEDKACLPANLTTLAERLRDSGYWTLGVTANRLLFDPAGYSQGFDRWEQVGLMLKGFREPLQNAAPQMHERIVEALAERPSDRFFLYAHWLDVHDYFRNYPKSVAKFDAALGRLLALLEAEGLLENSWIILTSDHGESLGEVSPLGKRRYHKGNPTFDNELRVPLIAVPSIFPSDARLIRSQDVPRHLLEALQLEALAPPSELEGDEQFVSERLYQTYRRGRFKSMRPRGAGRSLLFDLEADPGEKRDISSEHPDLIAAHGARMDELTEALKCEVEVPPHLTLEDVRRLQALGYAD